MAKKATYREPVITRTVKSTNARVMLVHINTQETEIVSVSLPAVYSDNKKEMLAVNEMLKDTLDKFTVAVAIVEKEIVEKLYALPVSIFMEYASEIPNRKNEQ